MFTLKNLACKGLNNQISGNYVMMTVATRDRPISQVPQCIWQISHNALFCNWNVHTCTCMCTFCTCFIVYITNPHRTKPRVCTITISSWYSAFPLLLWRIHASLGLRVLLWIFKALKIQRSCSYPQGRCQPFCRTSDMCTFLLQNSECIVGDETGSLVHCGIWTMGLLKELLLYTDCQTSNIRHTYVSKMVDHSDVIDLYIFILALTPGFNGLGKDNCEMRWETFKFWDLGRLILEGWWYMCHCKWNHW